MPQRGSVKISFNIVMYDNYDKERHCHVGID